MINIVSKNENITKIPGIFHDNSPENQEKADRFLNFLITEYRSGPQDSFTFAIFRDSIVSSFLTDGQRSIKDIILQKVPFLVEYPEQLENLVTVSTNDLVETLKHRPL